MSEHLLDFIHNENRRMQETVSKQLDDFIIKFFGTADTELLRELAKDYVVEEPPVRTTALYGSEAADDNYKFQMHFEYRIRRKTPEELAKERADEILQNNAAVGTCIVCGRYIFGSDETKKLAEKTIHGWYHFACFGGK